MLSIWRIFALLFLLLSMFQIFINKDSEWITQKAFLWWWHWLCDLGQSLNTSKPFLTSEKRLSICHPPFQLKSELWVTHATVALSRNPPYFSLGQSGQDAVSKLQSLIRQLLFSDYWWLRGKKWDIMQAPIQSKFGGGVFVFYFLFFVYILSLVFYRLHLFLFLI